MPTRKKTAHRVAGRRKTRKKVKKWERKAVKHPGRVERMLHREFGEKAFKKNGDIKIMYLNRLISKYESRKKKRGHFTKPELSAYRALILARTFIKQNK